MIGAAVFTTTSLGGRSRVRVANPLALFQRCACFVSLAVQLIMLYSHHSDSVCGPENPYVPHAHLDGRLAALSRTESSNVIGLVSKFKDSIWATWEALLRNGELAGGLQLCLEVEPEQGRYGVIGKSSMPKCVLARNSELQSVGSCSSLDIDDGGRIGALRLSGYLADPKLAESIEASSNLDQREAAISRISVGISPVLSQRSGSLLGPVSDPGRRCHPRWTAISIAA